MENQFTTTFIPKKPMVPDSGSDNAPVSRPVGLLSSISLVLFFITLALGAGVYVWEKVAAAAASVTLVQKEFEPQYIAQLQSLDKQLRNANILIKNHTVTSPLFDLLEYSTLKQVQFGKFDYSVDDTKGVQVKMSGTADSYQSIAQQSDVLGSSTFLKNVIFSNFFLTPQGKVSFDLSFGLTPDFVNFATAPLAAQTIPAKTTN
jgi:hypothetical protein